MGVLAFVKSINPAAGYTCNEAYNGKIVGSFSDRNGLF
jgi:hypothetical protein